ncbi:uncharacterized protein LOC131840735 [Achroia grisella]|uniref:uncharacterized protein LOC131840735 n=1 Tax=Achroia grisella TaxID=688607 RepID=UPI0027D34022|nr:uncharacterized protein LOC131840735 [Achroia grisella]
MNFSKDRKKNTSTSSGLGLAAAAIGVGVGAALYYFCTRQSENPNGQGSTSNWTCEQPRTLPLHDFNSSYTTISEHSTTDTSMDTTDQSDSEETDESNESESESETDFDTTESSNNSSHSFDRSNESSEEISDVDYLYLPAVNVSSDSEVNDEWDVTHSSADIPMNVSGASSEQGLALSPFISQISGIIINKIHRKPTEEDRIRKLREQAFRERSWSLEQCSICFEVMLMDQNLITLACTHNFHSACIEPWLQEQKTCPYCRKPTE